MALSKSQIKQQSKLTEIKKVIYRIYGEARISHPDFNELTEMKRRFKEHPDRSFLTQYQKGILEGIDDALFQILQDEWIEWLLYYTNRKGNVTYSKKWHRLPEEIKDNGNYHGNYFWKTKKRGFIGIPDEYPPFGVNPEKGTCRK